MRRIKPVMCAVLFACSESQSAVSVVSMGAVAAEDFDALVSSSSGLFVDNSTMPGWTVNSEEMDSNADEYWASTGSRAVGEVYSFGAAGSSERALGYIGSGGNDYFNAAFVVVNDTGATMSDMLISYTGEQWRSGGNTNDNQNRLSFSFRIFSAGSGLLPASTSVAGWTQVSDLDFLAPQTSLSAGLLDGNAVANQTNFSQISLGGISLDSGDEIWLRWTGGDGNGTDAGLAIDDLSIVTIPEPSSMALLATGICVFVIRRKRKAGE